MTRPSTDPVVGFLGLGNMALAIARGFAANGGPSGDALLGCNRSGRACPTFPGVQLERAEQVIARSDIVILAMKPWQIRDVQAAFGAVPESDPLLVSLAAGASLDQVRTALARPNARVVRVMPNVAAAVARSTNGIVSDAPEDDIQRVERLFAATGRCVRLVREADMHAFTAVAGSGPAYAFLFAEALADAAVAEGLSRPVAREIAAAMIEGAASLLLADPRSPAEHKDAVCSPGGTTIEGVLALEAHGLRAAAAAAVRAAAARSRAMADG